MVKLWLLEAVFSPPVIWGRDILSFCYVKAEHDVPGWFTWSWACNLDTKSLLHGVTNGRDKQERSLYPCLAVCMCSHAHMATLSCVQLNWHVLCSDSFSSRHRDSRCNKTGMCSGQDKIMGGNRPPLSLLLLCSAWAWFARLQKPKTRYQT